MKLLSQTSKHMSAKEIYAALHKYYPGIGLTTVYRTLDLLARTGLIHKFSIGDGHNRYEFVSDDRSEHHHHLICTRCGKIINYSEFVEEELATFDLPLRRVRREVFGQVEDITTSPGFPQQVADETFRIKAHIGGVTAEIPAKPVETVLVAMERADLAPPSQCRSGECGFCRSLLVHGDVFIRPERDGRRAADKQFGYIHPCSSYPITDLEVTVPRDV